jgi:hypothetical protein
MSFVARRSSKPFPYCACRTLGLTRLGVSKGWVSKLIARPLAEGEAAFSRSHGGPRRHDNPARWVAWHHASHLPGRNFRQAQAWVTHEAHG